MKKLLFTLFITSAVMLLSSCIIVPPREYDITLHNEFHDYNPLTYKWIDDWYIENKNGVIFRDSPRDQPIEPHGFDTIHDLPEDYYYVVFAPHFERHYYKSSTAVYLDNDVEYELQYISIYNEGEGDFYDRSVSPNGSASPSEPQFYLLDSNGNRIELHKVEK